MSGETKQAPRFARSQDGALHSLPKIMCPVVRRPSTSTQHGREGYAFTRLSRVGESSQAGRQQKRSSSRLAGRRPVASKSRLLPRLQTLRCFMFVICVNNCNMICAFVSAVPSLSCQPIIHSGQLPPLHLLSSLTGNRTHITANPVPGLSCEDIKK